MKTPALKAGVLHCDADQAQGLLAFRIWSKIFSIDLVC